MAQRGLIQSTLPESFARAAAVIGNGHGSARVRRENIELCIVFTKPLQRRKRAVRQMLDTLRTRLYKMKKWRVTQLRLYNAGPDSGLGLWAAERKLILHEVTGSPGEVVGAAKVAVLLWDMIRAPNPRDILPYLLMRDVTTYIWNYRCADVGALHSLANAKHE